MEIRSVETIVRALNDARVQYLIVGGLAVNAHGYERLTVDVDLVIGLKEENILRALRTLQAAGWQIGAVEGRGICGRGAARIVAPGKEHGGAPALERSSSAYAD